MKLTDAERLILINQYEILQKLTKDKDAQGECRWAIAELHAGIHETCGSHACPELSESVPAERLAFADDVVDMYEGTDKPFYGFRDERLNRYVRYREYVQISKGTPPSDEEYRTMLFDIEYPDTGEEAESLSNHQQV